MYKICIYIPANSVEKVKKALFDAGAGHIGHYDSCCWQTNGTGQFRPLENSQPTIGEQGQLEKVEETKIELVCEEKYIKVAIMAMKQAHPYEEPAYTVIKTETY